MGQEAQLASDTVAMYATSKKTIKALTRNTDEDKEAMALKKLLKIHLIQAMKSVKILQGGEGWLK